MKRRLLPWFLLTFVAMGATAQDRDFAREDFIQDHKPSELLLACLDAPTRACALRASLQTVVDEKLNMERAKILAGLSQAFVDLGQLDRAAQTLDMALKEVEGIGISFAVQIKLQELAPLNAYARNAEGAFSLAERITIRSVKNRVYGEMAQIFGSAGMAVEGSRAIAMIRNPRLARYETLGFLEKLAQNNPQSALQLGREYEANFHDDYAYDERLLTYRRLALLYLQLGEGESFVRMKLKLTEGAGFAQSDRMRALSAIHMAYIAFAEDTEDLDAHVATAILWGSRLRSLDQKMVFATMFAPLELQLSDPKNAIDRLEFFESHDEKALYMEAIVPEGISNEHISAAVLSELSALDDIDSAYERDEARIRLLKIAHKMQELDLTLTIVRAMEDDDNMARGLAEAAALMPE